MEEDLAILGVYEVFLMTNELQDFIENLVVLDKYHYFKTRLVIFKKKPGFWKVFFMIFAFVFSWFSPDFLHVFQKDFDEIEQFDKSCENQLEILFIYKKYLTNEQRNNLEKIIRAGDDHLLVLFNDFKKNHKNNEDFLTNLVLLADRKTIGNFSGFFKGNLSYFS